MVDIGAGVIGVVLAIACVVYMGMFIRAQRRTAAAVSLSHRLAIFTACTLSSVALVPAASATTFGMSDANGHFASCPTNSAPCITAVRGYWNDPAFTALGQANRPHQLTMIRVFVPYDAVWTTDGAGGCQPSNPWRYGYTSGDGSVPARFAWTQLYDSLVEIHADGYVPVVAISGYSTASAIRRYPGSSARGDPGQPDPTSSAGWQSYKCGVQGIATTIDSQLPPADWPHYWEAWNEPNGGCTYLNNNCTSTTCAELNEAYPCSATGSDDASCTDANDGGAAKAACLAVAADAAIKGVAGHATDTLIDGTFSWPSTGYLTPYYGLLKAQGKLSSTWSVHDYGDVTASGWLKSNQTAQLSSFDRALDSLGCSSCQLWVTEAGVNLLDADTGYNGSNVSCPAGSTLGACVSGDVSAETAGAMGFFNLATVGPLPVTHLFWYEWQAPTSGGWDSGMLDTVALGRSPYCVWLDLPPDACTGSASAKSAGIASPASSRWSVRQPGGPSADPWSYYVGANGQIFSDVWNGSGGDNSPLVVPIGDPAPR